MLTPFKRRHSLRWQIPTVYAGLVAMVLAAFVTATYREIRGSLARSAAERAHGAARQLGDILEQGLAAATGQDQALGDHPDLRALASAPDSESRAAARRLLASSRGFQRTEVWDRAGTLVLEVEDSIPGRPRGPRLTPEGAPSRVGVSHLTRADSVGVFALVSGIRSADGQRIGYLRRYGTITSGPGDPIRRLVGGDAAIRLGSPTGGVWTDLSRVIDAPPAGVDSDESAAGTWIGAREAVAGTPWVVWVGFPRESVLAPAAPFIRRVMAAGGFFLLLTLGLVTVLGVRLTMPIRELNRTAVRIAMGDLGSRVGGQARGEIGQLSRAFNRMADQVEAALETTRTTYQETQFALSAAGIGVWRANLETGAMECSESMREVLGLVGAAPPTHIDQLLAIVHPEDRDALSAAFEAGAVTRALEQEVRVSVPDRAVQWLVCRAASPADKPSELLGICVNVTEQRRIEAQLRQAQKMEAVGQLAGGIAHDFNNLLTAIVGNASLLQGALKGRDDLLEEVAEILRASESAAGLIRQLLAFGRRQVMQPQVIDLNGVVTSTEKLLRRLVPENISLVTELSEGLDRVRADPGRLEQVLVNLVVNARDAMPDGGRITIATGALSVDEALDHEHATVPPGRYAVLSVHDDGMGMDAETRARLFEPFFTTKEAGVGTGLGLATVFGIVKQTGGHIYVYSEPGQGASFKIYLPATGEAALVAPRAEAAAPSAGTGTVLVVEDNPAVRAIASRILQRAGYSVLEASSGEEALQVFASTADRPILVITDLIMPGISGTELARRLGERFPGVRVLFTSGYAGDALRRQGIEEPGVMFIEKPYSPTALAAKVRDCLGSSVDDGWWTTDGGARVPTGT